MSWLEKLLPPRIAQTAVAKRRGVPEGLWTKCAACDAVLYKSDLEKHLNVCPHCDHTKLMEGDKAVTLRRKFEFGNRDVRDSELRYHCHLYTDGYHVT